MDNGLGTTAIPVTPEASQYLDNIEAQRRQDALDASQVEAKTQLLDYCKKWYEQAQNFRKSSYENDWYLFQQNADGRYDPNLAAKKKAWQSKTFVDLTASHRENIHAALFKLIAGSKPPLEVGVRNGGNQPQADNIKDLLLRDLEKSRWQTKYNAILEDADTFGSGHARVRYEVRTEDRLIRTPIPEDLNLLDAGNIRRHMTGKPRIMGYKSEVKPQTVYRGVDITHIPIWDVFWDPKGLGIRGTPIALRSWIDLQYISDLVSKGVYRQEAYDELKDENAEEMLAPEKGVAQAMRGISDVSPTRTKHAKRFEVAEFFCRLPQKWIFPLLTQPLEVQQPEALIPARVIFHKKVLLCVELNTKYDGEAPLLKLDYMHVNNRYMGRGIPEMLRNPQAVINEVVNQRLDEGDLALQQGMVVIEKALVNPEDLEAGGPGLIVRLKQKELGPNGDVRNAVMPLIRPDLNRAAAFNEVYEHERLAQERSSANRTTLGTAGQVHDMNETARGQFLLKQAAGEKFAYIALVQEFSFMTEMFRMVWEFVYANIQPQDVIDALGQERAQTFQLLTPEQVNQDYKFEPQGIFQQENKGMLDQALAELQKDFAGAPWIDPVSIFDQRAKALNLDPATLKIPNSVAAELQAKAQQIAGPMAQQLAQHIIMDKALQDARNLAARDVVYGEADELEAAIDARQAKKKKEAAKK